PPTLLYTLSLHDALPILLFYAAGRIVAAHQADRLYDPDLEERIEYGLTGEWSGRHGLINPPFFALLFVPLAALPYLPAYALWSRSEEHTSELQSRVDLVC